VDRQIVERLRRDGHAVEYVAELAPGLEDEGVLASATHGEALLITADKDFGELVFRQRQATHGVVLLRVNGLPPHTKADLVSLAIARHLPDLGGRFTVVEPGAVRMRPRK
jgi:predicted nuclease of predicted toxin-antitoxin system